MGGAPGEIPGKLCLHIIGISGIILANDCVVIAISGILLGGKVMVVSTEYLLKERQDLQENYGNEAFDVDEWLKNRRKMEEIVDNCKFETPEEVANHFIAYTAVIWDYKMVGKIHDCYHDQIIVHREGGNDIVTCESVIRDTLMLQAAFSALRIVFYNIFCEKYEGKGGGFRFGQAVYFAGTNDGYSKYGPPTGKQLTQENCLGLCECLVQEIDGRWRIAEEWTMRSSDCFEGVMKM